jgi:segregation and condensation protein B
MRRIEAVLFASASPVPRTDLARVVGQAASVDLLIEDLMADLDGRSFEVAMVSGGWMPRTRTTYAPVIRTAHTWRGRIWTSMNLTSLYWPPSRTTN